MRRFLNWLRVLSDKIGGEKYQESKRMIRQTYDEPLATWIIRSCFSIGVTLGLLTVFMVGRMMYQIAIMVLGL